LETGNNNIMAQHVNYWSCSKFADWIRGTKKLGAGTTEQWDDWTNAAKMKHNFRYWLAEEGLSYVQDFVTWPVRKLYDVKYYVNNRWITRSHALTAHRRDIRPGDWCDVGNRFLPCLFNELVDFVEVELAWWHLAWSPEERPKYNMPWWAVGWWRIRLWRCPQAGLDNLEWQRNLRWTEEEVGADSPNLGKLTPQAIKAQEILDLYRWWTDVYPNRPEPMEASGWSAYCDQCREELGGGVMSMFKQSKSSKLKKQGDRAHKLLQKIEAAYEKEDEEMMIRLIKVRHGLWT
jgi:hypothetical protein